MHSHLLVEISGRTDLLVWVLRAPVASDIAARRDPDVLLGRNVLHKALKCLDSSRLNLIDGQLLVKGAGRVR